MSIPMSVFHLRKMIRGWPTCAAVENPTYHYSRGGCAPDG